MKNSSRLPQIVQLCLLSLGSDNLDMLLLPDHFSFGHDWLTSYSGRWGFSSLDLLHQMLIFNTFIFLLYLYDHFE